MAHISFVCKRTMVSSKPVQPGKTCQLSVFDRIMENHNIRIVLYYNNLLAKKDGNEMIKRLKESLAEVISSFPIATGRLAKAPQGHWFVVCNDAGVRIVEAMAEGNVVEWLKKVDREKELELVYWEDMFHKPYFWSTFYIQLTEFKEGGLAIGLSCSHLLADPISATIFLKAWTETTLGCAMTTPPLFHPLPPRRPANTNSNHRHHHDLISHYKYLIPISPPMPQLQHITTVALEFSHESVTTCIAYHDELTLTPFEALATLFWVAISNVKGSKSELLNMSICLDMRKELGLDKGFFGNCMACNKVEFVNTLDQNKSMLHKASLAIQNAAKKMNNNSIMDLVEWLERNDHQTSSLMCHCDLLCIDLENVEAYNLIFDDELKKPIRASYYIEPVIGEGQLLILPSSREGLLSRMVMVTLPANEAVKLCQEALLLEFSPTISLCAV